MGSFAASTAGHLAVFGKLLPKPKGAAILIGGKEGTSVVSRLAYWAHAKGKVSTGKAALRWERLHRRLRAGARSWKNVSPKGLARTGGQIAVGAVAVSETVAALKCQHECRKDPGYKCD